MVEKEEKPMSEEGSKTPRRSKKRKGAALTRPKEFLYRGRTLEELRASSEKELLLLLPSRARRLLRKGLSEDARTFLENVRKAGPGEVVRTHLRDFPVLPDLVGKTIGIHDGKEFKRVEIVPEMIGHKLGEFALTRKPVKHTGPGVGATRSSKFMPLK